MAEPDIVDSTKLFPGPDFHIDLAPSDALHPEHYGRRLLIFRCPSVQQRHAQLKALEPGLQSLVSRCPLLAGLVAPHPAGKGVVIQPGDGLGLVIRDMHSALPSFEELEAGNFQPEDLPYEYMVPVPQDLETDRPYPACRVQYTAINGGTIITWAVSHRVADGAGNNLLFRILSEEVRYASQPGKEQQNPRPAQAIVGMDRSMLSDIKSSIPFDVNDHPGYVENIKTGRRASTAWRDGFTATSPESPVLIYIPASGLQRLKADATQPDAPFISTHDAIVALIWRSVLRIRRRRAGSAHGMPWSVKSTVFFPSDGRRHLELPSSYVGNAVYQLAVSLDLGTLLSRSGLQYAAAAVRQSIKSVSPEAVASLMATYKERWVDWAFMAGSLQTMDVAMATNWTSGSVYEDNWGSAFGPLVRFRYPGGDGLNAVLPKLKDGGAEVIISVMPEEADLLRSHEYCGKYL